MIYTLEENYNYVPKWNGNREKKKEDQFNAELGQPSGYEMSMFFAALPDVGEGEINTQTKEYYVGDFLLHVKKFNNFKINQKGKIVDVTPRMVAELPGFSALYTELKMKYFEKSGVVSKN